MCKNSLEVTLSKQGYEKTWYDNINFEESQYSVSLENDEDKIKICVDTSKTHHLEPWDIFSAIYEIIFLCTGKFPQILSIEKSGCPESTDGLLGKFATSKNFVRSFFMLKRIDSTAINGDTINRLNQFTMCNHSLTSFEYVVCQAYEKVLWEHKLTLMLHTIEGVCNYLKLDVESLKNEFGKKYSCYIKIDEVGNYISMVNYIFENTIFKNEKIFLKLCKALNRKNEFSFLQGIEQFRNFYSHMDNKNVLSSRIKQKSSNIVYLFIFAIVIRCFISENILGIDLDSNQIESAYLTLYDYIMLDIKKKKNYQPLSSTYRVATCLQELKKRANALKNT